MSSCRILISILGQTSSRPSLKTELVCSGAVVLEEQCREVWSALQSIGSDKAPGPDGFASKFFKSNWHNAMPKGINSTVITLIPKVQISERPED